MGEIPAIKLDSTRLTGDKTNDHIEAGRFSSPVGSKQSDYLPAGYFE
jgi:hypothetical protein